MEVEESEMAIFWCIVYQYLRVFHENMFLMKKMAQPALEVGGCFEGIQIDFVSSGK